MKKYIFGAIFVFVFLIASPAVTEAAGLTSVQIQAIISLLSSFGADASVIANVQAALTGATPPPPSISSLTAAKYTGYGDQMVVPGTQSARIGSLTLSAGASEGIDVNTIVIHLGSPATMLVTNLTLKNDMTGAVLGSVQTMPSTSNSFAVSLPVAQASSVVVDVYADIVSSANANTFVAKVGIGTRGVGHTTGVAIAVSQYIALQTITIGAGSLTVTRSAGDPVSNNVLAGASSVRVGQFNFAAQNSAYTIQSLAVLVPNSAATSVTAVTVSYKDVNNVTQTQTQGLAVNAGGTYTTATATFTGLTMYVPMNDSANLDVSVGTPSIASGATSGAAISVALGGNNFMAVRSDGLAITSINSGANLRATGMFYVRKSIPTFAMVSTGVTVPSTGSPLYKFSITADLAGAIEWSKVTLNLSTVGASVSNLYLVDDTSGSTIGNGSISSSGTTAVFDLTKNTAQPQYQQIAAGSTKTYNLYGTVAGFATGSTITISLAADGSPVANGAASAAGSTSWSDRSAPAHTISTSDWTNGYLLRGFVNSGMSYSKNVPDVSVPTITIISPNGGEVWQIGNTYTLHWTSQGADAVNYPVQIGIVDTRYSSESGLRREQVIADSIPNTGSYSWTVPQSVGTMNLGDTYLSVYKIIVHSRSDAVTGVALSGASSAPFAFGISTANVNLAAITSSLTAAVNTAFAISGTASPTGGYVYVTAGTIGGATIVSPAGVWSLDFSAGRFASAGSYPITVNAYSSTGVKGALLASGTLTITAATSTPVTAVCAAGSVFDATGNCNPITKNYTYIAGTVVPTNPLQTPKCSCDVSQAKDCAATFTSTTDQGTVCYDSFVKTNLFGVLVYKSVPYTRSTALSITSLLGGISQTASALNALSSAQGQESGADQAKSTTDFTYSFTRNLEVTSPYTNDISALQIVLIKEGVYSGEVTGGFYTQTYAAVQQFQTKYGIDATGFVGPVTRAKLNELYAK